MKDIIKKYIISITITLVLVAFCFLIIVSFISEIQETSQSFISKRKNVENLNMQAQSLEEFEDREKVGEALNYFRRHLTQIERPAEAASLIREFAEENDLESEVNLSNIEERGDWSNFDFELTASGSFFQIFNFLRKMERHSWVVDIYSLSIRQKGEGLVDSDMRVRIYFLEDNNSF